LPKKKKIQRWELDTNKPGGKNRKQTGWKSKGQMFCISGQVVAVPEDIRQGQKKAPAVKTGRTLQGGKDELLSKSPGYRKEFSLRVEWCFPAKNHNMGGGVLTRGSLGGVWGGCGKRLLVIPRRKKEKGHN